MRRVKPSRYLLVSNKVRCARLKEWASRGQKDCKETGSKLVRRLSPRKKFLFRSTAPIPNGELQLASLSEPRHSSASCRHCRSLEGNQLFSDRQLHGLVIPYHVLLPDSEKEILRLKILRLRWIILSWGAWLEGCRKLPSRELPQHIRRAQSCEDSKDEYSRWGRSLAYTEYLFTIWNTCTYATKWCYAVSHSISSIFMIWQSLPAPPTPQSFASHRF